MPGWDGFDIPAYSPNNVDAPVLVDNDVNLMALGEFDEGWPDVDHLLFVKIATGIGAGIVSDGRLNRGAQGVGRRPRPCAGRRRVDRPVHLRQHRLPGGGRGRARPSRPACGTRASPPIPPPTSSNWSASGDPVALQEVRQAGRDIGAVLATCVNLLNPSVIVIGGPLAEAGEHLLAGVREVVYHRSPPLATQHLRISRSRTGAGPASGAPARW